MKLKQWFFLLLAASLLITSAGCKGSHSAGSEDTYETYLSLSDEEYYGEPELILRATVDVIKKQYTTDPAKNAEQKSAEVTVYNLIIHEVYKGSLGEEMPAIFPVKIFNTENEPLLLTVGEEYILGLAFTKESEDEYGDGGGYFIIGPRRWTIHLGTNGSEYRNYETTTNVHNWESLQDLLDRIEKYKYPPEPDPQPVEEPKYKVDGIKKDSTITVALREQFYELYRTWRVDAMYEFTPEKPMELEFFKYYCAYFVTDEEKTYVDMGVNYSGAAIERIAKWFGTSYGLKGDEAVFLKAGSLLSIPFAEVIQYKKETVDGKTLVTARCIEYIFNDEDSETYSARKEMILKGKVTGYSHYVITDFSFYTEDGKTPTQFVSAMTYNPQLLADGYQTLPEFVPAKTEQTDEKQPEKATVVFDENPQLERVGNCLFYYGIKEFYPVLDGKKAAELREIAKTNNITGYDVFKQGKADAEKGLCKMSSSYETGAYCLKRESYKYPTYTIMKIDGIAASSFYLIYPTETGYKASYDQMILMNADEDDTVVVSSNGFVSLSDGVYFMEIQRFTPTIDGKRVNFEELLKNDPQAVEKLITQAEKDSAKDLCQKVTYDDGGSVWYRYRDYSIVNFHATAEDGYNEALVIKFGGMNYKELYSILFEGERPI